MEATVNMRQPSKTGAERPNTDSPCVCTPENEPVSF